MEKTVGFYYDVSVPDEKIFVGERPGGTFS
jgi:hypothetical protein